MVIRRCHWQVGVWEASHSVSQAIGDCKFKSRLGSFYRDMHEWQLLRWIGQQVVVNLDEINEVVAPFVLDALRLVAE